VNALSAGLVVVAVPVSLAAAIGGPLDVAATVFGLAWLSWAACALLACTGRAVRRRMPVPPGVAALAARARALVTAAAARVLAPSRYAAGRLPRAPLLSGWRLQAGVLSVAALAAVALVMTLLGSLAGTGAAAAGVAVLSGWCALSAWAGRPGEGEWTDRDDVILRGDLTMTAWERAGQTGRGGAR